MPAPPQPPPGIVSLAQGRGNDDLWAGCDDGSVWHLIQNVNQTDPTIRDPSRRWTWEKVVSTIPTTPGIVSLVQGNGNDVIWAGCDDGSVWHLIQNINQTDPTIRDTSRRWTWEKITSSVFGPTEATGPAGTTGIIWGETPGGSIDGANKNFTSAYPYRPNTCAIFLNGLRQRRTDDYTETGNQSFSFVNAPLPGDSLSIDYMQP